MMNKIVLGIIVLIIGVFGYVIINQKNESEQLVGNKYYQKLAKVCEQKDDENCCMTSLDIMETVGAYEISQGGVCDYGYKKEMLKCVDSLVWCEPMTMNDTDIAAFYQNLKENCGLNQYKECCLDSIKAMEVVGAKSFPSGKYAKNGEYQCKSGLKRMSLRCPGSYAWCQTHSDAMGMGSDLPPVPQEAPMINPGPGFDDDGNGPICTQEAKECDNGTYVGRTGPNCEFAECPGMTLPHLDDDYKAPIGIQLPANIISEEDCIFQGGEVWNTLGETGYDGELIGKVEELNCPCACLVK